MLLFYYLIELELEQNLQHTCPQLPCSRREFHRLLEHETGQGGFESQSHDLHRDEILRVEDGPQEIRPHQQSGIEVPFPHFFTIVYEVYEQAENIWTDLKKCRIEDDSKI